MELLTVKETARLLRVSPITIRRYIASGRLPAERVGRGIRVRRRSVEHFVTPIAPKSSLEEVESDTDFGKPFTMDDPLWNIAGIGYSDDSEDVAANKHKYLAEAILANME
jgi:excisionase family DNA binding protein